MPRDELYYAHFWEARYPAHPARVTGAEARHAIHSMLADCSDLAMRVAQIQLTKLLSEFEPRAVHLGRARYEQARGIFLRALAHETYGNGVGAVDPNGGFRCLGHPPKVAGYQSADTQHAQAHWIEPEERPITPEAIHRAREAIKGRTWNACVAELHPIVSALVEAGNNPAGVAAFLRHHRITKRGLGWTRKQAKDLMRDFRKVGDVDWEILPAILSGEFEGPDAPRSYTSAIQERVNEALRPRL